MSNCNGEIQHDRYPHTPQGLFIYSIDFSLPLWSQFWQNNDTPRLRKLTSYLLCWRAELLRQYQVNQQMTSCWPQRHKTYQKLRDWKHPPQLVAHDRASFYPRKNALLKDGNKSDRIDACKLAELLRGNQLKPVYHGGNGVRMLRELSRSYLTIVKDLSRVMNRLKAVYRSWAIPCAGRDVYYTRHRGQWLAKIREAGVRRRAERLYEQMDMLQHLRQQARRELLAESRKHAITAKLRQIPYLGPIRSALAVALIQTPHRFRSKRQLWAYSGLALETRISAEYRLVEGQVRRSKKQLSIRGLNKDHNHELKGLFKGAATMASVRPGPFQDFYQAALAKGIKPTMARLTLARKIAAITLTLWKKGENFDAEKLKSQAA